MLGWSLQVTCYNDSEYTVGDATIGGPVKSLNVTIPEPLEQFVQEKVKTGGYSSASEVVREGLRLLQQYDDERLRTLQAAIRKGLESGEGPLIDEVSTKDVMRDVDERLRHAQA